VDVLRDNTGNHRTLPGAIYMPGAGDPGTFRDRVQRRLSPGTRPTDLAEREPAPGVSLRRCEMLESYNAALRAMQLGYRNVLWYRGGLSSWTAAKQQLQPPAAVRDVIN